MCNKPWEGKGMSVELIKKPITLDEMTQKESAQVIKERDLIVPDGKPDMQSVVQLDGEVCIDQIDVTQDRVMYKGRINVCILYRTVGNTKCIYTMKGSIPIEDFMMVDGIDKDQRVDFDYCIEHMSYNILNERKINVKAIMEMTVTATGCKETSVITDVHTEGQVETKEDEIEIVSLCNEKEDKQIVKQDLTVTANKPCIGEILKTFVQIQDEQIKRTDSELKYNGMLEVVTMYKVAGDDDIQIISHRIPFEGTIDSPQEDEEMYWDCSLTAEPSYAQVATDYDGEDRIIECEFIVTAKYKTYNKASYDTVSDLYCPGKNISTKEKKLDYMNLKDKVKLEIPKKEAIAITDEMPDDVEVFSVEVKPTVEDKHIENGKVMLDGILECKLLLLSKNEDQNDVQTMVNMVPFTQTVDIDKEPEKSIIMPCVKAKDVKVYAQTRREIVIEYLLECMVEVFEQCTLNVLEEVDIDDMSKEELDAYPSMTVYQVKKGDNLWNLAKRFNTTVKDIEQLNDLDASDALREGQKIIILKKVRF